MTPLNSQGLREDEGYWLKGPCIPGTIVCCNVGAKDRWVRSVQAFSPSISQDVWDLRASLLSTSASPGLAPLGRRGAPPVSAACGQEGENPGLSVPLGTLIYSGKGSEAGVSGRESQP